MKKLIAPVIALALGFASISAFSADAPRDGATVTKKTHHAVKKHHSTPRAHKQHHAPAAR